jgi:flagellar motor protein MotB
MLFIPYKSQKHNEEVEEAGYLASASDLMVGLLFVFIIMVVILSQRVEIAESAIPSQPVENPESPKVNTGDPLASAVESIGESLEKAGVAVIIDPESGVITLPADTLFPVGEANLSDYGKSALISAEGALTRILPCYIYSERNSRYDCPPNPKEVEIETIFIEGHTDSTPLQRGIYTNWHLGLDRAKSVYEVLETGNMSQYKNQRNLDVVGFSSYADRRPNKQDPTDASKNRRVELRFVLAYKPEKDDDLGVSNHSFNDIEKSINQ